MISPHDIYITVVPNCPFKFTKQSRNTVACRLGRDRSICSPEYICPDLDHTDCHNGF